MRSQRKIVIIAVTGALVGAACSSDKEDLAGATTVPAATSTTVGIATTVAETTSTTMPATTTTALPTTTSTTMPPTTTSTTMPPTTTTIPPGASLPLRFDGIGDARFGTTPDDVTAYMTSVLGAATADSGWLDAPSRTCPGSEVRFVEWGDLHLLFSDDSNVSSGRRHFFAWSFGPPNGVEIVPAGMKTLAGIGVGSTVADIKAAYPAARIFGGDELSSASAALSDDLFAFLTDTTDTGTVISMLGGQGCGE
jgi:hypothetical protein